VARAAIDAIAHRVADIVDSMAPGLPDDQTAIRVDGGLARSRLLVQRQADLLGRPIHVASATESTALGVALMAAIGAGRMSERETVAIAGVSCEIAPRIGADERRAERARWSAFVRAALALGGPAGTTIQPTTIEARPVPLEI
jgi:glycerol kinase